MTTAHFKLLPTPLAGLTIIERKPIEDTRGFFCRFYCDEEFREAGLRKPIVQINHSVTLKKGAVRGLHFQYPPYAEVKIVSCLRGEIFDVAVDIRRDSSTFLHWFGASLSAENKRTLFIPEGFAHGYQALTEGTEILYLVTSHYTPEKEDALNVQDPTIGIQWPLAITELSKRDKSIPYINKDYNGLPV